MSIFVEDWFWKETRIESKQYIIKILTSHSSLPFHLVSVQNKGLPSYRYTVSREVRILWKLPYKALNKNKVRSLCLLSIPSDTSGKHFCPSLSLPYSKIQTGRRKDFSCAVARIVTWQKIPNQHRSFLDIHNLYPSRRSYFKRSFF